MTPEEYKQLKAFARQDGALLALLWTVAMACYILGLKSPMLGMTAALLIVISPFFAANRLRHFRDEVREGIISFLRGYAYYILTFFYGGLLLAAAIYCYFTFIDQGYLMSILTETFHSEEGRKIIKLYGMTAQMEEGLKTLSAMRPIDYALNMLTFDISAGIILGLPTAAIMQRKLNVEH